MVRTDFSQTKGLPSLKLPWELPAAEIPHYPRWLNYRSPAAAEAIGFPDPARDAELLSRARRTATGGWVVQLTDAPLDLDAPPTWTRLNGPTSASRRLAGAQPLETRRGSRWPCSGPLRFPLGELDVPEGEGARPLCFP